VSPRGLVFGIYPLSAAGTPEGIATGPPDDDAKIAAALHELSPVAPRVYLVDTDGAAEDAVLALAERYRKRRLLGHAVLGSLRTEIDIDRWCALVRAVVARHGDHLQSLQVTNEPNLSFMEGRNPLVVEALVRGVLTARSEAAARGFPLAVGFGSVPASDVSVPDFWAELEAVGGRHFREAVDFVGHNFYVDVFEEPMGPAEIPARVARLLRELRADHLPRCGIPDTVPIRVTENGWPTGTNLLTGTERTGDRQATVVATVVRAVHDLADELNITHYMFFGLRDADSSRADPFHQFGILRDDYTPKPAYAVFRSLIAQLGT
jgi:hypothetical protein